MSELETSNGNSEKSVVSLLDGSNVSLRRARSEDRVAIEDFLNALSEETLSYRFLESVCERRVLLKQLLPASNNYVLVAMLDNKIVGHTAYYESRRESAEIGIMILDAYQRKGLGTIMLERIAHAANANGISVFETIISRDNTKMIRMVEDMGFPTSTKLEADLIRIRFPTSIDPITIAKFEAVEL